MFFISSGKGWWIFAILFASLGVMVGVDRFLLPPFVPGAYPMWHISVALVISAIAAIALGIDARRYPPRLVLERQTGRERVMPLVHSAYWVRAEYWGLIFLLLAAWLWGF